MTDAIHTDIWAVCESMRSSFQILHSKLGPFVAKKLVGIDDPPPYDELYAFYTALGVRPDIADRMSELRLHWDGVGLRVDMSRSADAHVVREVTTLLLSVMSFKKYTDSRWCTVGDCCRSMAASLSLGLRSFLAELHADSSCSACYLAGTKKLTDAVCGYIITAGLASVVSDSLLVELIADDRLGPREAELTAVAQEEIEWLQHLPRHIWQRRDGMPRYGANRPKHQHPDRNLAFQV